ncbi:MAG: CRISPR-associated protein Cas4 [Caldisericia bacterium]
MNITGNLVNAYYICHHKLWLFFRELNPDPKSDLLELGKLISNGSYSREKKEILIENMKIDILKRDDDNILIGEIKKSSHGLKAAQMQLLFYLYNLKKRGLFFKGEILIPKEKKKFKIELTNELEEEIKKTLIEIEKIVLSEYPPKKIKTKFCTHCAFREFCWA